MAPNVYEHIQSKSFPCVMAKSLLKRGNLEVKNIDSIENNIDEIYKTVIEFSHKLKKDDKTIRSLIFEFEYETNFDEFESSFWNLLNQMLRLDEQNFKHDDSVSSDPHDNNFSYSLAETSYFLILLHPESPRLSRRSPKPCIVFNPHKQFVKLKKENKFFKIRNLIRKFDKKLQGFINPMMADHGVNSEILQYTGKIYKNIHECPIDKLRRKSHAYS